MSSIVESKQVKKGRGRGILSYNKPLSRPGAKEIVSTPTLKNIVANPVVSNIETVKVNTTINAKECQNTMTNGLKNQDIRNNTANSSIQGNHSIPKETGESSNSSTSKGGMLAKYNYKGNPGKPGGFPELTIKQGENLKLIRKGHEETKNMLWWEVRNEKGEQGFVPASYCMVIDQTPSSLPWLEAKRIHEEKEEKQRSAAQAAANTENRKNRVGVGFGLPANYTAPVKQYLSAYNNKEPAARNAAEANKEYYCEICDKNLNGPTPYKMHMSSKAHREYVEYEKSKDQYK